MEPNEQDKEKTQQNPDKTNTSDKDEYKEIIKYAAFFVGIFFLITSAYMYYYERQGIIGKPFPVNNTLSSDLNEAKTYTAKSRIDDSDMWETETENKVSYTTTVPLTENSETVYNTVVFPIDINLAGVEELVQIEGIGNVYAERIVNYRAQYGYFYDYDELLNIEGIGDKKLANLKKYIYIDDSLLYETETSSEAITEITTSVTTKAVTTEQTVVVTVQTTVSEDDEEFEIYEYDPYEYETDINISETTKEYYPDFPIELNSASVKDLMYIEGIGEVIAERIVEYADKYGFYSVEDLLNVNGIGESKLELISPYVYVNSYLLPTKSETTLMNELTSIITEKTTIITQNTTVNQIYSVNINSCRKEDLMQLPGIDSTLAENIISLRTQLGGFEKIEELSLVSGMTNEKLSAIWSYIYIS